MAQYENHTLGFTQTPNWIINNSRLSLKAKGLWTFLASKPSGWNFSAERIAAQTSDGRESIGSGLRELERAGLLKRRTVSRGYRKFETIYTLIDGGKIADVKYVDDFYVDVKPAGISNKDISNKDISNKDNSNIMPAPAKPAQARELPKEAEQLAERLYKWIKKNKPNRKVQDNWKRRWAEDIDKMHRIDGRDWQRIAGAIDWSQRDEFWHQNILSGANLRKHYDRIEERAILEMEQNGSQALASAINELTPEQAVAAAKAQGLL